MQDSLEGLAVELGLLVASAILEDEVTRLCGARYRCRPDGARMRYGRHRHTRRAEAADRPPAGAAGGGGEVPLETYAKLQSPEAMPRAALRRMVRGVSTREYEQVVRQPRVVRASASAFEALAEWRFDGDRFAVVMIDVPTQTSPGPRPSGNIALAPHRRHVTSNEPERLRSADRLCLPFLRGRRTLGTI
jgi:hypothetical protein